MLYGYRLLGLLIGPVTWGRRVLVYGHQVSPLRFRSNKHTRKWACYCGQLFGWHTGLNAGRLCRHRRDQSTIALRLSLIGMLGTSSLTWRQLFVARDAGSYLIAAVRLLKSVGCESL